MKTIKVILWLVVFHLQVNIVCAQTNQDLKPIYRIGYFDTPPLSYRNDNLGGPEGLAIDIISQLAKEHDFAIEWVYNDFPELLTLFKTKRLDALINVGYSEQRATYMDFSEVNFANVWGQVFLPSNSNIESLFDLEDKTIALMENDVNGLNFINQCEQFEVNCQYVYGQSYQEIFSMVADKKADAAVSNNLAGLNFQNTYNLLASSIVFNPFKVYITVPINTNRELLNVYNSTIAGWKQNPDSYYYQARYRWIGGQDEKPLPAWLRYSIMGLLLFALVAFMAAILFKREVKRRVNQLSQREVQLNQIINIVPHMIYANDYNGKLILANTNACEFFGISEADLEDKNIYALLKSNEYFQNLINYTTSSNPFNTEISVHDHRGNEKILMMSKVPYSGRNQSEPAVVTVGVDISQVKAYEKEIMYLAQYDTLTGLPNRELLKDRLKSSLARASQFQHVGGILHIDLDNFKNINESQGHKVGDKLIKKVAIRIKSCVSQGETLARLGGDEFIVESPELSNDTTKAERQAIDLAQSVLEKLKLPIEIDNKHYHISASIGLVIYPRDGKSQSELLQRADTAMFEAKSKGKNRIQVFSSDIETRIKKDLQLDQDLRMALRNEEIKMVFQPIVDAITEETQGIEILLRWQHPTEGTIMPTDFIPIAENSQLILEIGYWTIEEACKQINKWRKTTDKPFFIAVNLSVIQIRDHDFLKNITALIHSYQIPQNYLEFEVTESILLRENKRTLEIINQLKLLGIRLSIDDFGTGYSSFDYIRKLPLDKIKLDKSFIKDIPMDTSSTAIVKTILAMAEEMQLDVVAEGVENKDQIEFLRANHCQFFQGFYFSKPKPEDQFIPNLHH